MIRTLRLSDVTRQFLSTRLKSNDLLSTYLQIPRKRAGPPNLAPWTLPLFRNRRSLGSFHGSQLHAIMLLKARQRTSVWEISHAFSTPLGYTDIDELLIHGVRLATKAGAVRIFLRAPTTSPADGPAKRAGFKEVYKEDLMVGSVLSTGSKPLELHKLQASDLYTLFQLHSAVVDPRIRFAIAMTFEQWLASRETPVGYAQEYVWKEGSTAVAWLCINWQRTSIVVDAIVHPEHVRSTDSLLEAAYRIIGYQKKVYWVVRDHENIISNALNLKGWRVDSSYTVLMKSVTTFAPQASMLPIQV